MVYCYELLFADSLLSFSELKLFPWLGDKLASVRKCSPVNSNRFLAFNLFVYQHCLMGINVLRCQLLSWLVCSNWQNRQIKSIENRSQLLENRAITRIPRVVNFLFVRCLYHEASPQPFVSIKDFSLSPMARRDKCYFVSFSCNFKIDLLSPIHLHEIASFREHIMSVQPCNESGPKPSLQLIQGRFIEMIIVVMTNQYKINEWQVFDLTSRWLISLFLI